MAILRFYQSPALSDSALKGKLSAINGALGQDAAKELLTEYCYYVQLQANKRARKNTSKPACGNWSKNLVTLGVSAKTYNYVRDFLSHRTATLTFGDHSLPGITLGAREAEEAALALAFVSTSASTIISDSKSAILNYANGFISRTAARLLRFWQPQRSTTLVWTPAHAGLPGNEQAHSLARGLAFRAGEMEPPPQAEERLLSFQDILSYYQDQRRVVDVLHDRMTETRYLTPVTTFELPASTHSWEEVDILQHGREALERVSTELGLSFDNWDLDFYTDLFKNKLKRNPTTVECFDLAQSNSEHSRHWFFKGRLVVDGKEVPHSLFSLITATQNTSNDNNVIKFSDNSSAIRGYQVRALQPKDTTTGSAFKVCNAQRHIIFTAETHNFPTGYDLPWEEPQEYPNNFAPPLEVAVEASNGASDYGNKFGEPVLSGFSRSFGMVLPGGERREWIKPIMFSGGIGSIDSDQITKDKPEKGMLVVKIGGPVYRIGVGGGAASSVTVQGDQEAELDFGAVQRGDAEMEQKLHRLVRACVERGAAKNPIRSIHDQGAGGNGNVLKEIVEPAGAVIWTKNFQLGDPTITTMELWGAEYQESDAILVRPEDKDVLLRISARERCPVCIVGEVTGDGRVVLKEDSTPGKRDPVDLDLESVLGDMPRKVFKLNTETPILKPLSLPPSLQVTEALQRVLRLPSVASKRFLTNKVDRCVTGLVAQQQCVGPLHTPLADVAVVSLSYFDKVGSATAIGEQPVKGLLSAAAGARMSVAESVTNLMFAQVTSLQDVKCSGNWMWAAKLPGEGAALHEACQAMCSSMAALGIAVDGGKDSLSMAARVGKDTVKAPGAIVVSTYAPCPDITTTVTPDLKLPSVAKEGLLLYVSLNAGKKRLGGTALAQCFKQLGDDVPDLEEPVKLRKAFAATQELLKSGLLKAGHDISDGGLITCLLEMAFAGNCGLEVNVPTGGAGNVLEALFHEEVGWLLETDPANEKRIVEAYQKVGVYCVPIGHSKVFGPQAKISVKVDGTEVINGKVCELRDSWEETSYKLELHQCDPKCATQERQGLLKRTVPPYKLTFSLDIPRRNPDPMMRVAVLREEGVNSDREMAASFYMAGFEAWDVTMTDLLEGAVTLNGFRGLVFPGGFSYADVLGSARGWAASLMFHQKLAAQLAAFKSNPLTFSLGICNGCQLMALLGWVAPYISCRFEFRQDALLEQVETQQLVGMRYVDDAGHATEEYPLNPNGSPRGIAALCSDDGRHLAIMPHPERCSLPWQWAYVPQQWQGGQGFRTSPWAKLFANAYDWCIKTKAH
ncbi:phosphoribosylformylglycinamidine synthase-like [Rhipicephalus sanguineus]|uniref:phosphoribosylformylglycinamidine synthase-like n=1 Tax=Rhipicephalus sanguineus TaxID=34632 RepID=UPI0020C43267|nr:phosphoribosylformylglycinamidine synthase-like [Rhipicephalus sanguineus]